MTDDDCPEGFINALRPPYNADPTGDRDSTAAIQAAINDAAELGTRVWMPGVFRTTRPIDLG